MSETRNILIKFRDNLNRKALAIRAIKKEYRSDDAETFHDFLVEFIEALDQALGEID